MDAVEKRTNYKLLLFTETRDFLVRNNGEQVKAEEAVDGKTIGVYFAANWCLPCWMFISRLARVYRETNRNCGGRFEVVFVSADDAEEEFQRHFSEMPWLAVPFSDEDGRRSLYDAFRVQGIPHLTIIDEITGEVVDGDAMRLMNGAEAFPFTKEVEELRRMEEDAKKNQTVTSVLATSSRDYLLANDGSQVQISDLEGKIVGIYFSASRLVGGDAELFSILSKVYLDAKQRREDFEVVLVSLEFKEDEYKKQAMEMPWLALPFRDQSTQKLLRYFKLVKLPNLVLLGADGKTINYNVAEIVEEHGANAYLFSLEKLLKLAELATKRREEQTLESLLVLDELDYVLGKDDVKIPVKDLVGKVVLLYFSAYWNPPCGFFTSKLVDVYNELKSKQFEVEVVFISIDHDERSFDVYYSSMPWLALPYGDERTSFLTSRFNVEAIPTLVVLDIAGRTITTNARVLVMEHGAKGFPFTNEKIKKLYEIAESWPEKIRHQAHEHELVKIRQRGYTCDECGHGWAGWSFNCKECDYDMHPNCAFGKEFGGEEEDEKGKGKDKEGYICDGDFLLQTVEQRM